MASLRLTANEVAALVGVDEGQVRKEVEHGVAGKGSPPRFDFAEAVYFGALAVLGVRLGVDDRRKLHERVLAGMSGRRIAARIELSPVLLLEIGSVAATIDERWRRFEAWKRTLVTSSTVLGGEPVFPRSRLAVRNVGGQLIRGVSRAELREDYPYLSDEDLEFAPVYAQAYPKPGRPSAPQAAPR